jgi:hypothetical protein
MLPDGRILFLCIFSQNNDFQGSVGKLLSLQAPHFTLSEGDVWSIL